jgi:hypothetical protein
MSVCECSLFQSSVFDILFSSHAFIANRPTSQSATVLWRLEDYTAVIGCVSVRSAIRGHRLAEKTIKGTT